jgi:uncharacterized protein DUF3108
MSCFPIKDSLLKVGLPFSLSVILYGFVLLPVESRADQQPATPPAPTIKAFQPGESLTYEATWSNAMRMGTAVMEVKAEQTSDGRAVLRLMSTSRTQGAVGSLYPLGDIVQSVFDPEIMQPLSFNLHETQGKRQRRRNIEFDHEHKTAVVRKDEDPVKTYPIPDQIQDNLSSIYYLRTREDFTVGKTIKFETFDGEQSVLIEVQVLAREKVKTPAGEFDTIKVKAYKGFLMSEGEITIWLTDDVRKIPVLIKGKIKIGSIVFNLKELKTGGSPEPKQQESKN